MRAFRNYLAWMLVLGAGALGCIAAFDGVVDPFGIHRFVDRPGFNRVKPAEPDHRRMIKPYRMRAYHARGLVLGSSRAEHGLDPEHPAWHPDARPVYNAGLPDANPYEMRRMFQHALACGDLRQAVIGLDFYTFNVHFANRPDFEERRLAVRADGRRIMPPADEWLATFLSLDAMRWSVKTLRGQGGGSSFLLANGRQAPAARDISEFIGAYGRFVLTEYEYVFYKWRQGTHPFALDDADTGFTYLQELDRTLALATEAGVDLRLFISPFHARLAYALREEGLWEDFEAWKRRLAGMAERHGVPLWDFSGCNSITTEPVPPRDDLDTRMQGYRDASHYAQATGGMVLSRVLEGDTTDVPADFGIRLFTPMLDRYLARQRAALDVWASAHPADAEDQRLLVRLREGNRMTAVVRDLQARLSKASARVTE